MSTKEVGFGLESMVDKDYEYVKLSELPDESYVLCYRRPCLGARRATVNPERVTYDCAYKVVCGDYETVIAKDQEVLVRVHAHDNGTFGMETFTAEKLYEAVANGSRFNSMGLPIISVEKVGPTECATLHIDGADCAIVGNVVCVTDYEND